MIFDSVKNYLTVGLVIVGVGMGIYIKVLLHDKEELIKEKAILKVNVETLTNANKTLIKSVEDLETNIKELEKKRNEIDETIKEKKKIFDEHSLENLASKKPKLIERRMNKGIQNILEELEK